MTEAELTIAVGSHGENESGCIKQECVRLAASHVCYAGWNRNVQLYEVNSKDEPNKNEKRTALMKAKQCRKYLDCFRFSSLS